MVYGASGCMLLVMVFLINAIIQEACEVNSLDDCGAWMSPFKTCLIPALLVCCRYASPLARSFLFRAIIQYSPSLSSTSAPRISIKHEEAL
jgi:hypothetical protein